MDPWPAAVTEHEGNPLKLFGASVAGKTGDALPGTILAVGSDGVTVACLDGAVVIAEVQPAGKKRMPAAAWAAGRRIEAGARLGPSDPA